jgi:putative transposase
MKMSYDPEIHHRRSIRLHGYDYTQAGAYFVTVCAKERRCLFGEIVGGVMRLNEHGEFVAKWWNMIPDHFSDVQLDVSVVMPNHMHGIIVLRRTVGAGLPRPTGIISETASTEARPLSYPEDGATPPLHSPIADMETLPSPSQGTDQPPPVKSLPPLGNIIAYFKYQSTKDINKLRGTAGTPIWQRNYYEHIIRNEAALRRIQEYIVNNPLQWGSDQLHPFNPSKW